VQDEHTVTPDLVAEIQRRREAGEKGSFSVAEVPVGASAASPESENRPPGGVYCFESWKQHVAPAIKVPIAKEEPGVTGTRCGLVCPNCDGAGVIFVETLGQYSYCGRCYGRGGPPGAPNAVAVARAERTRRHHAMIAQAAAFQRAWQEAAEDIGGLQQELRLRSAEVHSRDAAARTYLRRLARISTAVTRALGVEPDEVLNEIELRARAAQAEGNVTELISRYAGMISRILEEL